MRLTVLVAFAGCAGTGSTGASDAALDTSCAMLIGRTFASVTEGECGLGPTGPVACTWHLQFAADRTFMWQHSDYGVQGTIACAGAAITGTSGAMTFAGQWAAATSTLTWDGVDYVPQ
jgi:hypothetical protein